MPSTLLWSIALIIVHGRCCLCPLSLHLQIFRTWLCSDHTEQIALDLPISAGCCVFAASLSAHRINIWMCISLGKSCCVHFVLPNVACHWMMCVPHTRSLTISCLLGWCDVAAGDMMCFIFPSKWCLINHCLSVFPWEWWPLTLHITGVTAVSPSL
jgi:hypothetical protein